MNTNLLKELKEQSFDDEIEEEFSFDLVTDVDNFQPLSLTEEKKIKDYLSHTKKTMSLRLDGRKLQMAEKIVDSLENNLDMVSDPDVYKRVKDNVKTAEDLKYIMETTEKQFKMLQNLMRLDSVDGIGTAAKIQVAVEFGDNKFGFGFESN